MAKSHCDAKSLISLDFCTCICVYVTHKWIDCLHQKEVINWKGSKSGSLRPRWNNVSLKTCTAMAKSNSRKLYFVILRFEEKEDCQNTL